MRRFARHVFTILVVLSLLLCVAVGGLWFAVEGERVLRNGGGGYHGGSDSNTYVLFNRHGWVGLGWTRSDVWFDHTVQLPVIPTIALSFLMLVAWTVARHRAGIRRHDGLCISCGYDLRASPERCPECGTPRVTVR